MFLISKNHLNQALYDQVIAFKSLVYNLVSRYGGSRFWTLSSPICSERNGPYQAWLFSWINVKDFQRLVLT